jgi:hypothetical protein
MTLGVDSTAGYACPRSFCRELDSSRNCKQRIWGANRSMHVERWETTHQIAELDPAETLQSAGEDCAAMILF